MIIIIVVVIIIIIISMISISRACILAYRCMNAWCRRKRKAFRVLLVLPCDCREGCRAQ